MDKMLENRMDEELKVRAAILAEQGMESLFVRFVEKHSMVVFISEDLQDKYKKEFMFAFMEHELQEVVSSFEEKQAKEEHGRICIGQELSDSKRIYFDMTKLPKELVTIVQDGWEMEVVFDKRNAKKVLNYLYPNGIKFDYKRLINRIKGNQVRLIGYGD